MCGNDKDYAFDYALDVARDLIELGWSDYGYAADPEGAAMLAHDLHLIEPHTNEYYNAYDDPEMPEFLDFDRHYTVPQWVIALWRWTKDTDELLPLAMSFEAWPVHGGTFDLMAEQFGWRFEEDMSFEVGGIYLSPHKWNVGLVCYSAIHPLRDFAPSPNACFSVIGGEIDWREWGMLP